MLAKGFSPLRLSCMPDSFPSETGVVSLDTTADWLSQSLSEVAAVLDSATATLDAATCHLPSFRVPFSSVGWS